MLRIRNRHGPLYAQLVLACGVLSIISFAPPSRGAMLIVSLKGERPGEIARWAISHDAKLIGTGPLPHSLLVEGSRATLIEASLRHAGLLVTGGVAGCGKEG